MLNTAGLSREESNRSKPMSSEVDVQLTSCFNKWYAWAEEELKQRFDFQHGPEQEVEVKKVDTRSLLPTQRSERPMPCDSVHEGQTR